MGQGSSARRWLRSSKGGAVNQNGVNYPKPISQKKADIGDELFWEKVLQRNSRPIDDFEKYSKKSIGKGKVYPSKGDGVI